MPLTKQLLPIPFAAGVQTKTDPFQLPAGELLLLQNCTFQTPQRVGMRNGYQAFPNVPAISQGISLDIFKNELLVSDGTSLYSRDLTLNTAVDKGLLPLTSLSTLQVVRNTKEQTGPDAFESQGLICTVWEDSRGGIRYSVQDSVTDMYLVSDGSLDPSATTIQPKVLALANNTFIVIAANTSSNTLNYYSIPLFSPVVTPSTGTSFASGLQSVPIYDAALAYDGSLFVAYSTSAGISVIHITAQGVVSSPTLISGVDGSQGISVLPDQSQGNNPGEVWVTYAGATTLGLFIIAHNLSPVLYLSPTVLATASNIRNVGTVIVIDNSPALIEVQVFYEQTTSTRNVVHTLLLSFDANTQTLGSIPSPSLFLNTVGIAAKPFLYNSQVYLPVAYQSQLQNTYFIALLAGTNPIVAKWAQGIGGGYTERSILPNTFLINSDWTMAYLQKGQLQSADNNLFSFTGVSLMFLTVDATPQTATIGNDLNYSGGEIQQYDASGTFEQGFNTYPEGLTAVVTNSGGGIGPGAQNTAPYQWQYIATYEWYDNFGDFHVSTPSVALTISIPPGTEHTFTASGTAGTTALTVGSATGLFVGQVIYDKTNSSYLSPGTQITAISGTTVTIDLAIVTTISGDTLGTTDTNSVAVTISTLGLTSKQSGNGRTNVIIALYRTTDNETTFYKVSSLTNPTYNSVSAASVTITDAVADPVVLGNELLYTTGGVLDNSQAPASSLMSNFQNRLVLIPSEDPTSFWFSQQRIVTQPVQFSDQLVMRVNPQGGPVTAVAQMDDKIILFKDSRIYYTAGQGPNSLGLNNDFFDPQLVTTDCGCTNPQSIGITPQGLMFQSKKGIYLLDRSLQASYIGAPVEAYNDLPITSTVLVPTTNQVRFLSNTNICLVYDYFVQQWSVFSNHNGVASVNFQDLYTYLDTIGIIHQETPGSYTDEGNFIPMKIQTGWYNLAGLQAFGRAYRAWLLGEYHSPHKLQVNIAYDFKQSPQYSTLIDATALLDEGTYGSGSPYGSDPSYGGSQPAAQELNPQLYEWQLNFANQKCTSFQLTLETVAVAPYGQCSTFSGLTLQWGSKVGGNKLGVSRKVAVG